MNTDNDPSLRCTVHWIERDRQQQRDFLMPDRPLAELAEALCDALGIQEQVDGQRAALRRGPRSDAWPAELRPSRLGIRDGEHVWLLADPPVVTAAEHIPQAAPPPAAIVLPDGSPLELRLQRVAITRGCLLQTLSRRERWLEQLCFRFGTSPYLAVSAREAHCEIIPADGAWSIVTERHDVETWLNRSRLVPRQPQALGHGDWITPGGPAGPQLVFVHAEC